MELTISLPHGEERLALTGVGERNLKIIRETLGVHMSARDDTLRMSGESGAVGQAARIVEQLKSAADQGRPMDRQQLLDALASVGRRSAMVPLPESSMPEAQPPRENRAERRQGAARQRTPRTDRHPPHQQMGVYTRGRSIQAITSGQQAYLDAIDQHDLTFCVGPAGTGKTFLAVAAAVEMLKAGQVRKLVLVRPAVEAGEKLGFLPGDLQQKVNPYLRPLLDALHDMMDFDQVQRFMACDVIELLPLAFMRGRTLNDAMIILDEAQNTTRSQMLMFLTRLGHGSKMVVTGDASQTDLEDPSQSGLIDAVRRLQRTPGVATVGLGETDIVRHSLVQRIVDVYGQKRRKQPVGDLLKQESSESQASEGEETGDSA